MCDPVDGHLLLDGGYVNNLPGNSDRIVVRTSCCFRAIDVESNEKIRSDRRQCQCNTISNVKAVVGKDCYTLTYSNCARKKLSQFRTLKVSLISTMYQESHIERDSLMLQIVCFFIYFFIALNTWLVGSCIPVHVIFALARRGLFSNVNVMLTCVSLIMIGHPCRTKSRKMSSSLPLMQGEFIKF